MTAETPPSPQADELLAEVGDLAEELHGGRRPQLALDSDLGADAGLDSLGRVELMLRLQRRFGVDLAEDAAIAANTPRDLLAALTEAPAASARVLRATTRRDSATAPSADPGPPTEAATLVDVLDHRAAHTPDDTHVILLADEVGDEQHLSYAQVRAGAAEVASGLRGQGLAPGEPVALMLPTGADFFFAFHGVLRAGGVPVPLYPPVRADRMETHARRLTGVMTNAEARFFVASPRTRPVGRLLQAMVASVAAVATVDELRATEEPLAKVARRPDDLAFLQYTSGTTGDPKGVMLTHANLLANIRAMGPAVGAGPQDRFVSWLPLYHDMGLIGACLTTLYFGVAVILMSPLQFMTRPERWLWAIHRHGGTMSAGPNFAYDLAAARIDEAALAGLDLSSWRLAFNGAEPVSPRTLERFATRFHPYGFDERAFMPVYGLAESSVGLVFPPTGRGPKIDRVDHERLAHDQRAEPAAADPEGTLRFVSCGQVLAGHELRVVDANGAALPERREGRVQFRGPSCTSGYYRNPDATRALFTADGWLESGDRAYVADGELFVTGRTKDLIIRGGRNIHPEEIEAAVSAVDGIRKNNVAAFASGRDPHGERLIVMAETRITGESARDALVEAARNAAAAVVEGGPSELVLVLPGTIPKTSSGKIQRSACRTLFETGAAERPAGPIRQWLRLIRSSVAGMARRSPLAAARRAYGLWCWVVGLAVGLPGAVAVVVTPMPGARAGLARAVCRALLALTGVSLRVSAPAGSAHRPAIVVANHASYLDGLILRAALPGRVFFIAKHELARFRLADLLLRRIGVEYVDRSDHRQGLADLERIQARTVAGETPIAFPEGVLADGPGLRDFRVGPFMVSVNSGVHVLPVAIRGSRRLLPCSALLPRPAHVELVVGEPEVPEGDDWAAALALRERARAFILSHCDEPDLATAGHAVAGNV